MGSVAHQQEDLAVLLQADRESPSRVADAPLDRVSGHLVARGGISLPHDARDGLEEAHRDPLVYTPSLVLPSGPASAPSPQLEPAEQDHEAGGGPVGDQLANTERVAARGRDRGDRSPGSLAGVDHDVAA